MKLTKRETVLLAVFGIMLAVFVYYRFVFVPESSRIAVLTEEQGRLVLQRIKVENKAMRIRDIGDQVQALQKELAELEKAYKAPLRLPELLEEIHQAALVHQVKVDGIAFSGNMAAVKGQTADGLVPMTMNFSFQGHYADCMKLIRFYENRQGVCIVSSLSLQSAGEVCSGMASLQFFSVHRDDKDFKYPTGSGGNRLTPFQ